MRPSARWQNFVDTKSIAALALVSFIATQLGTYFGYVFPAVGLPVLPWPLYNGILGTTFADGLNGATADAIVAGQAGIDAVFATSGESFFTGHADNEVVYYEQTVVRDEEPSRRFAHVT